MEKIQIRDPGWKNSNPGSGSATLIFLVVLNRLKWSPALERFRPNCMHFDVLTYTGKSKGQALVRALSLLVVESSIMHLEHMLSKANADDMTKNM
jgi:hypothetical protein